jgi:phenylalanyl-tRNA synthetase alpha chain
MEGAEGSIGWRYNWSEDEARKNILRTHTTAVSARMLYKLAQVIFFFLFFWLLRAYLSFDG